jgi:serine/threonine-protein kinase
MGFFAYIIVYGFFIPNTWRRTAVGVVGMALAPILMTSAAWFVHPSLRDDLREILTLEHVSYTGLTLFIGVVASVAGTHVIDMMRTRTAKMREMGMYQLKERIATGGMGEVWKAEHRLLARPAAIKVIRSEILKADSNGTGEIEKLEARFKREARITASLRSPHTIELYDFGVTTSGTFYYVMEYLYGLDLDKLVSRFGPQPPERVVYLLNQAADSLGEAHESGLVHRDIKPSNLFVSRMGLQSDFLKILDFGLVRRQTAFVDLETKLTKEGVTTGTPAFMAPELALGKGDVDNRSDIYALGCVGYWLLTGALVFNGSTPMEIVVEHVKSPPVPPSKRTEVQIPSGLDDLILACLEKDPGNRPENMNAFLKGLEKCSCSRSWTEERARDWWNKHLPKPA